LLVSPDAARAATDSDSSEDMGTFASCQRRDG
jgi:hypothetical protein